jgi:methionyl-tRNA formyltransferase
MLAPGTIVGSQGKGCYTATGEGCLLLTQVQLQKEEVMPGDVLICRYELQIGMQLREEGV